MDQSVLTAERLKLLVGPPLRGQRRFTAVPLAHDLAGPLDLDQCLPLRVPAQPQRRQAILRSPVSRLDLREPLHVDRPTLIPLALQQLKLPLERHQRLLLLDHRCWLRVVLDAHTRRRGVEQVDRLVRQLSPCDIAMRQLDRRNQRLVLDRHLVGRLVGRSQPTEHHQRLLLRRLVDLDRLEPPRERGVLLKILLVLRPRGRGDRPQLAARERRLEQVGGVVLLADDRVRLVDEQHDRPGRRLDLLDHCLEPLLELPAHPGPGLQQPHVELEQLHAAQRLRHVARSDRKREPLDQRRLADTGLTDDDRVVLAPSRQDLRELTDLRMAPEDRVDLPLPRLLRVRGRELPQRLVARRCTRRRRGTCITQCMRRQRRLLRPTRHDLELPPQRLHG